MAKKEKIKITNQQQYPLPLALGLLYSDYDAVTKPKHISTTTVLKPVRALALAKHYTADPLDIEQLADSVLGTAFHNTMENVWTKDSKALVAVSRLLGVSDNTLKSIIINPTGKVKKEELPLYIENRRYRKFKKWTVHGKYDFIWLNAIHDYKVTKVFSWKKANENMVDNDYIKQLAINKWLNPDIQISNTGYIIFFFKDWNKYDYARSTKEKPYPKSKIIVQPYDLSRFDVEAYLGKRLKQLNKELKKKDPADISECSPEDRWAQKPTYKFYTKKDSARAYRTANNPNDLQQYLNKFKDGYIKDTADGYFKCRSGFCSYAGSCTQFQKQLIEEKEDA